MDLNESRSKQKAAQQKAQVQTQGVGRIGDRDAATGRYEVVFPDGGIDPNGIKTYSALSKLGDIVVMFPRTDGAIALDSEKGLPVVFPDVFNEPKEEKKAKVWILYEANGRLFVGGHQAMPVDVGVMPVLGQNRYNLHVWGDATGWVATWQKNTGASALITFYTADSLGKRLEVTFDANAVLNGQYSYFFDFKDWSFPLGAGFTAFRSRFWTNPSFSNEKDILRTSIGYLSENNRSFSIVDEVFGGSNGSEDPNSFDAIYTVDVSGMTKIPHLATPLPYRGKYVGLNVTYGYDDDPSPFLQTNYATESVMHYAILCDRSSTYYIKETVLSGGSTVSKAYELFSSVDSKPIAINKAEPRFFGIRWDLRAPPNSIPSTYNKDFYTRPFYFYPHGNFLFSGEGRAIVPVGYYRRSIAGYNPATSPALDRWNDYEGGTPVTFSGGGVVKIPSLEIDKARSDGGLLKRISMSVDGKETELSPVFCHPIPATAKIKHWSTTAL